MHHFNSRSCIHTLDHTESESEGLTKQAPVEEANPELAQGKQWCIPSKSLIFILIQYFIILSLIIH
jgi:hypothetical protein